MATSLPDRVACYRHDDHLTTVHCTRCGRPICPECISLTAAAGSPQCPSCAFEAPRTIRARRWGQVTPVVATLVVVNFAVFAATSSHRAWEFDYAQIPQLVAQGQVYRLLTATFVHENLVHVVFNMVALFVVGPPVEAALGRYRFLVVYLLAALGGSVCSYLFGPVLVAGVGASGAILGVIGAWFALARAQRADTAAVALLIALLLAYSFYDTSIDWRAHVGGLATGVAVGAAFAWSARRRSGTRVRYDAAMAVALLLLFAVLVVVRSSQI
jgi:membrane associated rhomboid family serine protease